ncbi:MAG: LytTR family transcriptional regulator DNA-binding domain-containing protein [Paludibacteraceae bacterium]|nr:LytTR family transcriptional regulator DNA-binding domain-containing protein [Paludibacteraceae bacterium]MBN2787106.1 LytTR family transcriptional regulator DNA-binding domain-containing protein [Paludibacteraceae bacterium]
MLVQHFLVLVKKERILAKEEEEEKLTELLSETETTNSAIEIIDRIAIKLGSKIHVISVPDILYLQAEGDYVMIYTPDGNFLKEQTMKYFEQHLPQQKFVRVHRSCIVNVEIISRVELYEKQNYLLHLQNGTKIKASTNGYRLLKKTLSL